AAPADVVGSGGSKRPDGSVDGTAFAAVFVARLSELRAALSATVGVVCRGGPLASPAPAGHCVAATAIRPIAALMPTTPRTRLRAGSRFGCAIGPPCDICGLRDVTVRYGPRRCRVGRF